MVDFTTLGHIIMAEGGMQQRIIIEIDIVSLAHGFYAWSEDHLQRE